MQNIIAVVFDFDDTLAPDSTSSFLNNLGVDVPKFWQDEVQPLIDSGWDPVPAYLYKMLKFSSDQTPITKESLRQWGHKIVFYEGVTRIFNRLKNHVKVIDSNISAEFYLISSGIGEIVRNTKIAKYFTDIWACDFNYDIDGQIEFPKNIVSFTDKTRYLFQIAKGIYGEESRKTPFDVNKKVDPNEIRIPFRNMIYVGDGLTDIPCFSLVSKQGGVAIAVFDRENKAKWGRAWGFMEHGRAANVVPADYSTKSALSISLIMAVENMAKRIDLQHKIYQG